MKRMLLLAATVAVFTAFAERPAPSRVDLASQPEGAFVSVDGVPRGNAPLTLWDLEPGEHLFSFSLPEYENEDFTAEVVAGGCLQQNATLTPQKGLLLVVSEPADCDLLVDNLSLGTTPRLVTDLDVTQTHRLTLRKTGYLPQQISVKFTGRTPLVKQVKMMLDSGTLVCSSEPAGATVVVNGEERGVTPLTLERLPKGRSSVTFRLDGYQSATREVDLRPGDERNLSVALTPLPGEIQVTSDPRGARIYLDGKLRGNAPLKLSGLVQGEYLIRAEGQGLVPFEKTVYAKAGECVDVEMRLESDCGTLEVRSNPAGAQVLIDGRQWGVTRALGGQDASETLKLENVPSGDHTVVLRLAGYADATRQVTVTRGGSVSVAAKLKRQFIPDVEVRTLSGAYRGVLLSNNADGVTIETSPGVSRSFRHADIRELNFLTDALK